MGVTQHTEAFGESVAYLYARLTALEAAPSVIAVASPADDEASPDVARALADAYAVRGARVALVTDVAPTGPSATGLSHVEAPWGSLQTATAETTRRLAAELRRTYDIVVLDSPALARAQGLLACAAADGTVMVVRLQHTRKDATASAQAILDGLGARLLGIVVAERPGRKPRSQGRRH